MLRNSSWFLVKLNFEGYLSWIWHRISRGTVFEIIFSRVIWAEFDVFQGLFELNLNSYFLGLFEGTWKEYAPLRCQLLRGCICQCWGCSQVLDVFKSIKYSLVCPSWSACCLYISLRQLNKGVWRGAKNQPSVPSRQSNKSCNMFRSLSQGWPTFW